MRQPEMRLVGTCPPEGGLLGDAPAGAYLVRLLEIESAGDPPVGNVPIMHMLGTRPPAGKLVGFSSFKPVLFGFLLNFIGFLLLNSTHIFVVCYLSEIKCCYSNYDTSNRVPSIIS